MTNKTKLIVGISLLTVALASIGYGIYRWKKSKSPGGLATAGGGGNPVKKPTAQEIEDAKVTAGGRG